MEGREEKKEKEEEEEAAQPGLCWERGGGICTALCKTGFLLVYLGKIVTNKQTLSLINIDKTFFIFVLIFNSTVTFLPSISPIWSSLECHCSPIPVSLGVTPLLSPICESLHVQLPGPPGQMTDDCILSWFGDT